MTAAKMNMVREHRAYYSAGTHPELAEFSRNKYMTLQGKSRPGGRRFREGIDALFTLAYRLKFEYKAKGMNFSVPRLECQWWSESGKPFYESGVSDWVWKLMIMLPDYVSPASFARARDALEPGPGASGVAQTRMELIKVGKCVQMMHVGPYEGERETAGEIAKFISDQGLACSGPFHEIYISDPAKTSPDRLKTIIRQPVKAGFVR